MRDYQAIDATENEHSSQPKTNPKRVVAIAAADSRYAAGSPQVVARIPSLATADPVLNSDTDPASSGRLFSAWLSKKILAGGILLLVVVAVGSQFIGGKGGNKDKDNTGSVAQDLPRVDLRNQNAPDAPAWPGTRTDPNSWQQAGAAVPPMSQDPNTPDPAYNPSRIEDWRHPTETVAARPQWPAQGQPAAAPSYEWDRQQGYAPGSVGMNRSTNIDERAPIAPPDFRGDRGTYRDAPYSGYRAADRNEPAPAARTADNIPDWRAPPRENSRPNGYVPSNNPLNSRTPGSFDGAAMPTNYQDYSPNNGYQKASPAGYEAGSQTNYPSTKYPSTSYPATNYPATNYPATNYPATNYGPASDSGVAQFEGSIQKPNVRISNERTRPSIY